MIYFKNRTIRFSDIFLKIKMIRRIKMKKAIKVIIVTLIASKIIY